MTKDAKGLVISNLSVRYGRQEIIQSLSLEPVERGQFVALLGPNAAGKSTFLKAIAGIGSFSGKITLDDVDINTVSGTSRAQLISYMPQSQPPAIGLSALEAVMSAFGGTKGQDQAIRLAYEAFEDLGASELAMRNLYELSGGQRQIVALAQAIVRKPEVLLLDEPTSALDLKHQVFVMQSAARLARMKGAIVVVVLHDVSLALRYADRIAVLKDGALHAYGTPQAVVTSEMLADVYGIEARIENCSQGRMQLIVDNVLQSSLT